MTCETCGEKPKKCGNCNKDFPRSVIEINNPETLVLLRKVVIPASMGTEEQVPAAIGKYHNVILKYEANKHVYLYSSDGIPTLLEMDVPQEVWDSIDELQDEIDEMKNNPDVVDIVDTYADLESYDTSELGDKDVIRVLNDETHDGESTYYRWNLSSQTWTFIGGLGPYYTKDETNTLIDASKGSAKELTSEDYNWPTANPDGVAVWSLPTGLYRAPNGVNIYNDSATSGSSGNRIFFVNSDLPGSNSTIYYPGASIALYVVNKSTGSLVLDTSTLLTSQVVDALTSTATNAPLSANQGKVLKDMIDDLPSVPTVVQDTGESTTNVMSQKAVRDLIFHASSLHPDSKEDIQIGNGAKAVNHSVAIGDQANYGRINDNVVAIGHNAYGPTSGGKSIVIGYEADCHDSHSICIGSNTYTTHKGCIMLGSYSNGTVADGTMYIGTSDTTYGYNASNFRLLSGLYDPQTDHDAATKGYVDNKLATKIITSTSAPSTSTVGEVGTLCAYVTSNTGHLAICTEVVSGNPNTYTWQTLI